MPDGSMIQRSFAGGEVAPALYARADQVKYQTGLRTCRNFLVRRHGGVANRCGSQMICEMKDSTIFHKAKKFVFNADQTYVLLFGDRNMRVVRQGVLLTVSGVTAWSNATAYVIGDLASLAGVNYYCILAHTNQTPPNATYWYALPGVIYEIPTPYVAADVATLYLAQSGDVISIDHHLYAPMDLARTGHTTWTLTPSLFAPVQQPPTGVSAVNGTAGTTIWQYQVTAIADASEEESTPVSAATPAGGTPTLANPNVISWTPAAGATTYNVYRDIDGNGVYGFIGAAIGAAYNDTNGVVPDASQSPPITRNPFNSVGNYPSTVGYFGQRRWHGGMDLKTETVIGSKPGMLTNYSISSPLQASDACTYTLVGKQVNQIRHIVDIGNLIILTSGSEWVLQGDGSGALTPNTPGGKQYGYNGASAVPPLIIGSNLLFIQARGNMVRDFRNYITQQGTQGYLGDDLTVFASHLFENVTLVYWDYQQIPHSIAWAVRTDGVLLGLTYLKEHEISAWHHHDTDGFYEDVCVVPEGPEDMLYIIVRRTIQGVTRRYLERFPSRVITDVAVDARFLDSYLTYDGRNVSTTTMTLSGGTNWDILEQLTLTASAAFFAGSDVGSGIVLFITTTTVTPETTTTVTVSILLLIEVYSSPTVVLVRPVSTVDSTLRAIALTSWSKAVSHVSGLTHLEGKTVGILADGQVVTNGLDTPFTVVTGGAVTLDRLYSVIHVGLPYVSDLETLDLEVVNGETLADKNKRVTDVTLNLEATRGLHAGESFTELTELPPDLPDYGQTMPLITDKRIVRIQSTWNLGGRTCVRQRYPLPATVLAIVPHVGLGG